MTDYEDDSDGELPSISLSQSSGVKTEFSMPPATELAAQREREAAAELELQKLRDAEAAAEAAAAAAAAEEAARRRDHAGEMLSSGVSALEVSGLACKATQRQVEELRAMAAQLPAREAAFLAAYAGALQDAPSPAAASAITNQVVSGVCVCVSRGARAAGAGGVGGAAAALLTAPAGPRVRRALHALLDHVAEDQQVDALITAARAGLRGAARRLAAHDAARSGARAGADRLAAALLAAAVHDILHGGEVPEPPAPLSLAVAAAARGRWRRLPAARQLLLLRCAARALAAGARDAGGAGGELLAALAQPLPRAPPRTQLEAGEGAGADLPLRHQVLANVAKLQLLFGPARAHHVDESTEQEMIMKKEVENEFVPMTELEHDSKAECENGTMAQMAPEQGVEGGQEPADAAGWLDPGTVLELNMEVEDKVLLPSVELEHDDGTIKPERETEVVAPELEEAEGGRGAVEGEAMEVEAASPGSPGPPESPGPRPAARRSPRLAARPQPADA